MIKFGILATIGILTIILSMITYELKDKALMQDINDANGIKEIFDKHNEVQKVLTRHAICAFIGLLIMAFGLFGGLFLHANN